MVTYEQIAALNKELPRVDVKGKAYSMVASRVQAFRKLCPAGSISTEIISLEGDRVVMRATITDEGGRVLSTGTAFETQGSSYINKTSFIENCETSAVGRALGMLGIGSESSMASAEELSNAIAGQAKAADQERQRNAEIRAELIRIAAKYEHRGLAQQACDLYGVNSLLDLFGEDAEKCLKQFQQYERKHGDS